MYKRLMDKGVFNAETCCTGEQLKMILTYLDAYEFQLVWYGLDIQCSGFKPLRELIPNSVDDNIYIIGNTKDFVEVTKYINQFDSGVFIAFAENESIDWNSDYLPETNEEEGIQHRLGIVEIRAFDYTYFEIYSINKEICDLIDKLKKNLLTNCKNSN